MEYSEKSMVEFAFFHAQRMWGSFQQDNKHYVKKSFEIFKKQKSK